MTNTNNNHSLVYRVEYEMGSMKCHLIPASGGNPIPACFEPGSDGLHSVFWKSEDRQNTVSYARNVENGMIGPEKTIMHYSASPKYFMIGIGDPQLIEKMKEYDRQKYRQYNDILEKLWGMPEDAMGLPITS